MIFAILAANADFGRNRVPFARNMELIQLVPYDPAFVLRAAEWQSRLASIADILAVHHVGSTAVPDLLTKPILDLAAETATWPPTPALIDRLAALGFSYHGEAGVPGRHWFTFGTPRAINLHVFAPAAPGLVKQLNFRDHLRANRELRSDYEALKTKHAANQDVDSSTYALAKTEFIDQTLSAIPGEGPLEVREMQSDDIPRIVNYWIAASDQQMAAMGVDLAKRPKALELTRLIHHQLELPLAERSSYCLVWLLNGLPVGHCNTNPTTFGQEANMHLHLWSGTLRRKGLGLQFIRLSLPYFFRELQLETLYCQPFSQNPAPNRTLARAGFTLEKTLITIPGSINYEQEVNRWKMERDSL